MSSLSQIESEKISVWSRFIRDVGVPVLMLGVMTYAMYEGGLWVGNNILMPTLKKNEQLVDSQLRSNEALLKSLEEITRHIHTQTDANKANSEALLKMSSDISAIRSATEKTAESMETMNKMDSLILEELRKDAPR